MRGEDEGEGFEGMARGTVPVDLQIGLFLHLSRLRGKVEEEEGEVEGVSVGEGRMERRVKRDGRVRTPEA